MSGNSGPGYAKHPNHPVKVTPFRGHVVVEVAGRTIADSRDALEVREANYPPVYYLPRSDVQMDRLQKTHHVTHCPFKGDASYFSISDHAENAVWSYEQPYDEVISIRDRLAFLPDKVDAIRVEADPV
jgi:uncharacterized protein (DUF427 family)